MVAFEVDPTYFYVLAVMAVTTLHCTFQGFAVGPVRKRLFTKEFFLTKFNGEFDEKNYPKGGYPDCGAGYYSNRLSHADWQLFASTQRGHLNYLEYLPGILALEGIAGLFFPRLTLLLAVTFIVARQLYSWGYRSAVGPKGRVVGFVLSLLANLGLLICALYGAFNAAGGVAGVQKLFVF